MVELLLLLAAAALLQALDGTLEDFSYRKCLLALFPGNYPCVVQTNLACGIWLWLTV
jgi:hypothetical protein